MEQPISPARNCAQIRQLLRLARCTHDGPLFKIYTHDSGYLALCPDCDRVAVNKVWERNSRNEFPRRQRTF